MDIPYHDSTVFDALHAGGAGPPPPEDAHDKVENLLGMPEQPLPRDKLFPPQAGQAVAPVNSQPAKTGSMQPAAPVTPPAAAPPPSPASALAKVTTLATSINAPVAAPVAKLPAVKLPVTKTSPPATGQSYIQLGAVQSAAAAEKVWSAATAANGGALAGMTLHVEKAALSRGTFYRVQAGPVSADKAHAVCAALNSHKAGSCLVAKR